MEIKNVVKNKATLSAALFFIIFFFAWHNAEAATMYLSTGSTSVSAGQTFNVSVVVNAQGEPVNDASGTIQFPASLVSVLSVSKGGTFPIWVEEPSYSNSSGTITFEGGVPTPGLSGSGTILSFVVQAKATGTVNFTFSDAAVRANDGNGTDVLSRESGTTVTIAPKAATPPPAVTPATTKAPTTTTTKTTTPTPVLQSPATQTIQVVPTPEVIPETVPAVSPSFWDKVLSSSIVRGAQAFSLNGIGGLLFILLIILLAIIGTYLWLRWRGSIKGYDDIISDADGLKMLTALRKRLEKHLGMLQTIRHTRILSRPEKKMKEDIEADLDDVDTAIAKIKG